MKSARNGGADTSFRSELRKQLFPFLSDSRITLFERKGNLVYVMDIGCAHTDIVY